MKKINQSKDVLNENEQEEIKDLNESIILLRKELKQLEEIIKEKTIDLDMIEKLLEEKEQEIIEADKVSIEPEDDQENLIQETPSIQDIQIIKISIQNMEIMLEELIHASNKNIHKVEKLPIYGPKRKRGRHSRE